MYEIRVGTTYSCERPISPAPYIRIQYEFHDYHKVLQITLHVAPSTVSTRFTTEKGSKRDISRLRNFILLMYYADVAGVIH